VRRGEKVLTNRLLTYINYRFVYGVGLKKHPRRGEEGKIFRFMPIGITEGKAHCKDGKKSGKFKLREQEWKKSQNGGEERRGSVTSFALYEVEKIKRPL